MSESIRTIGPRRLTIIYVAVALVLGLALITFALLQGLSIPYAEARQIGLYQQRILRLARDGIQNRLEKMARSVERLSVLPGIIEQNEPNEPGQQELLDREMESLDLDIFQLRRYSPEGALIAELPGGPLRIPRLGEKQRAELLSWASQQGNQGRTVIDLATDGGSSSFDGLVLQITTPIWELGADGSQEFRGILCLDAPATPIFAGYLERTHLVAGSYSFVLSWRVSSDPAIIPSLVWRSGDPTYREPEARETIRFRRSIADSTPILEDYGDGFAIADLPQRDGRMRREVISYVPIVFGLQRWVVCVSSPYASATENSAAQQHLLLSLGLVALASLLVGVALLGYQRRWLELEANEQRLRQLRSVQRDYQELFAENPTAMLVFNDRAELVDCNKSAERLLGVAKEEAVGKSFTGLFDPSSVRSLWDSMASQGNLYARDTKMIRLSDSSPGLVEIWGRRIGDAWILMAQDVEDRRSVEQQLSRLKRMDSMGALASTLAHDFNNLLGQIQILVSNLRDDIPQANPLQESLQAIENKVDDASQLVSNLLVFQETVLAQEPVWLEPVLRDFVSSERKILPADVELSFDARPDLPPVWITPHALRRVLGNLCRNAYDAMPNGGRLILTAAARRIVPPRSNVGGPGPLAAEDFAIIEVVDTGIGMADEVLDRLFQPFFTTKPVGQGTGLGLWNVYKIIRRAGGWVQVQSRLGKGTRFLIYLPRKAPVGKDLRSTSDIMSLLSEPADPDEASVRREVAH